MLYREIIAVFSQIHTKHINTAVWTECYGTAITSVFQKWYQTGGVTRLSSGWRAESSSSRSLSWMPSLKPAVTALPQLQGPALNPPQQRPHFWWWMRTKRRLLSPETLERLSLLRRSRLDNPSNTGMLQTGLHRRMLQSHWNFCRWCINLYLANVENRVSS